MTHSRQPEKLNKSNNTTRSWSINSKRTGVKEINGPPTKQQDYDHWTTDDAARVRSNGQRAASFTCHSLCLGRQIFFLLFCWQKWSASLTELEGEMWMAWDASHTLLIPYKRSQVQYVIRPQWMTWNKSTNHQHSRKWSHKAGAVNGKKLCNVN